MKAVVGIIIVAGSPQLNAKAAMITPFKPYPVYVIFIIK
jgi:hypothetical protein